MAKRPPNLNASPKRRSKRGWANTTRKGRKARGYGHEWDKLRARVLKADPLCRSCKEGGLATVATTVDHIKPKHLNGTDDWDNLQPLCTPCHKKKTAKEAAEATRRSLRG